MSGPGYERFVITHDDTHAFDWISQELPDIVLLDVVMPNVSGLDILRQLRKDDRTKNIPVLILTASTDRETRLVALQRGATDFLAKPVDPSELVPRVRNALVVKAHQDHLQRYAQQLEDEVRQRTAELDLSRREIIECLARAAEYRDDTTGKHIVRVGRYAAAVARQLGLPPEHVDLIEQASQLHDVGKIGIPDDILRKNGKLDFEEFALMKRHCVYGQKIPSTDHRRRIRQTASRRGRSSVAEEPQFLTGRIGRPNRIDAPRMVGRFGVSGRIEGASRFRSRVGSPQLPMSTMHSVRRDPTNRLSIKRRVWQSSMSDAERNSNHGLWTP